MQNFLDNSNLKISPTEKEIELVVFGRGYGECILFKYSNTEYMIIDSFINPDTNNPIAIDYLNAINVPIGNICKVVITHWHGDHIAGVSDIINHASSNVKVIINPIIKDDRFANFISLSDVQNKESIKEIVKVFSYIFNEGKQHIILASNNKLLFDKNDIKIKALSPQDREVWDYIGNLNKKLLDSGVGYDAPDNNELSIVLLLKYQNKGVLLGSDLEDKNNSLGSWKAIVESYDDIKSDIFKIPHHGSSNAHNSEVWTSMLESFPISVLTTFNRSTKLPKEEDKNRIVGLSKELYVLGSTSKKNKEIERLAKKTISDVSIFSISQGIGMLRYRYNLETKQSKIEAFGEFKKYINSKIGN